MPNFCWSCGRLADESNLCQNTQCKNGGKDCTPNYLEGRLKEGEIGKQDWFNKKLEYHNQLHEQRNLYACHNCEYLMWHHLQWCPKCGGKFSFIKTTYKEVKEKYGKYRVGY